MTYKESMLLTKWFGEEFIEKLPWDVDEELEIDTKLPIVIHSFEGEFICNRNFLNNLIQNPLFERMHITNGYSDNLRTELVFNIPEHHRTEWKEKIEEKKKYKNEPFKDILNPDLTCQNTEECLKATVVLTSHPPTCAICRKPKYLSI